MAPRGEICGAGTAIMLLHGDGGGVGSWSLQPNTFTSPMSSIQRSLSEPGSAREDFVDVPESVRPGREAGAVEGSLAWLLPR